MHRDRHSTQPMNAKSEWEQEGKSSAVDSADEADNKRGVTARVWERD